MLIWLLLVGCPCCTSCSGCAGWGDPCKDDTGIVLTDEQNYAVDVSMELELLTAAPWTDLELCWDELSTDLYGEELQPLDEVVQVQVVRFSRLTSQEVLDKLAGCGLRQADVSGYVDADIEVPSEGCLQLSELDYLGTALDPAEEMDPEASYLLVFSSEGELAWMALLELDEDSDVTRVSVDPDVGEVLTDADMATAERIPFVPGCSSWVDWTGLEESSTPCELKLSDVERLRLGRFDVGREELEQAFPAVDELALEIWEADVDGLPGLDLMDLPPSDLGNDFQFLDPGYTWVLALDCVDCSAVLAPVFLGVFDQNEGEASEDEPTSGASDGDEQSTSGRDACD